MSAMREEEKGEADAIRARACSVLMKARVDARW